MKGSIMRLQNLVPVLDVRDVEASIEFYRSSLGFAVYDKVEWGGQTEWALLRSGQVQLMLCASQDGFPEEDTIQSDNVFFIFMEDMDALELQLSRTHSDFTRRDAAPAQSRDFYLRDPDGYVLWFSPRPLGNTSGGSVVQDSEVVFA